MSKKILIYGGNSLISKELIKIFNKEEYDFIIFCRKAEMFLDTVSSLNIEKKNFEIIEAELEDLDSNLKLVSELENNIEGVIWVAGYTGDPSEEFKDIRLCQNNFKVNFLHPVLIINKLLTKNTKSGRVAAKAATRDIAPISVALVNDIDATGKPGSGRMSGTASPWTTSEI